LNSKQLEWRIFFIEIRILFLFRNRLTRKQKKHRRKFMQECDVWDVPDVRGVEDFWEYFLGLWDDDTDSDETDQDEIDLNEPFIEELPEWNLVDDFWMHPPPEDDQDEDDQDEDDQDDIDLNEPFIEELPGWNLWDDIIGWNTYVIDGEAVNLIITNLMGVNGPSGGF
jgi:hypothetical protein